jgi:hypothetical protein
MYWPRVAMSGYEALILGYDVVAVATEPRNDGIRRRAKVEKIAAGVVGFANFGVQHDFEAALGFGLRLSLSEDIKLHARGDEVVSFLVNYGV